MCDWFRSRVARLLYGTLTDPYSNVCNASHRDFGRGVDGYVILIFAINSDYHLFV